MKKLTFFILIISLLFSFFIIINQGYAFDEFVLGVQISDSGGKSEFGNVQYTPWIHSGSSSKIHWCKWAMDSNGYDPDAIRICLYPSGINGLRNIDIRFAIQLSDCGSNCEYGTIQYTPWASTGGGWSNWATDINGYDPDAIRIGVETRYRYGFVIYNLRAGIKLSDCNMKCEFGIPQFTHWASFGGGWSNWATDQNAYDPDAAKIYLEAYAGYTYF